MDTHHIVDEIRDRYGVLLSAEDVADLFGSTPASIAVRSRQPRTHADYALARARLRIGRRVYWRPAAIAQIIVAAEAEAQSTSRIVGWLEMAR